MVIRNIAQYALLVKDTTKTIMPKIAKYLQSCANKKINEGIKPENAPLTQAVKQGNKTLRDNGELAASIAPHNGDLWAAASTNKKQARILQEGGTITAKKKALFIPAGAQTKKLMITYGTRRPSGLIEKMKADGYSFFRTPLSKVFFAKKGKRGKPFALFIIRKSVKIPERPFLYIDGRENTFITNIIRDAIFKEIKKGASYGKHTI